AMLAILVGLPVLIALGPESNFVQACVNPFPYFDRLGETLHWWGASLGFRMEPLFEPLLLFGFLYGTAIVVGLLVMNARFDPVSGRS
ncbi:MAG: hypothetical protein HY293_15715, partial [Planctomycetes bacterium]|nr:hypothetical protein [Planctomycetota bacterium]